jgi:hypothetical protein
MLQTVAIVAIFTVAGDRRAGAPAPIPIPVERALGVPVVVVGKVTSIEADTVEAIPYPGAPNKVAYRIAVVKIEAALAGAAGTTHLKVGFVPPAKPDLAAKRPLRPAPTLPDLREGEQMLLFLRKHHDGGFYTFSYSTPPVESTSAAFKAQVESVKQALMIVGDPITALRSAKAADRFDAATVLITKYRSLSDGASEVDSIPLATEENRLILAALAAGDWKLDPQGIKLNGFTTFYRLGLGDNNGWKTPAIKPGEDYMETTRQAFVAWLAGPGKYYRINKLLPKVR